MPASSHQALFLRETPAGTEVPVRVAPRAKRSAIAGLWQNALRVEVAAVPREGKANDELCAFLASLFGVPHTSVRILRGERSKDKVVLLRGVEAARIRSLLAELSSGVEGTRDKAGAP